MSIDPATITAPPAPIQLLTATLDTLTPIDWMAQLTARGISADAVAACGISQNSDILVRHRRNRPSPGDARPSVSLVWNGTSDSPDDLDRNQFERIEQLDLELVFDFNLPAEDSDLDPTGWLVLSTIAAIAFNALRADGSPLAQRCDYCQKGDTNPDDEASGPDNGRLVQVVTVVYRVLSETPDVLLWPGAF